MDPTLLLKAHERLQRCMADDRDGENPDDPSTVQSMPIILNIPKVNPPAKTDRARGCRQGHGGVLFQTTVQAATQPTLRRCKAGMVRGSGRSPCRCPRCRPGIMRHDVPGVTVESGTAKARACVPTAVVDTQPLVSRLQIGGTDLPGRRPGATAAGRADGVCAGAT